MKTNIGIRRQLAPLLENDRNQLELFTALLLSLPGSPVLYYGDDIGLCVNNLSRFPQPVELDLRRWEGCHPIELLGTVQFPQIGELPYLLTLAGHGFYWFRLAPQERIL